MMTTLLLGGLMGLLGQGARTVVGLKSMSDEAKSLGVSPNDLFQAARLLTSLMIGFLVGLAAALIYIASGPPAADAAAAAKAAGALDWHILLGFAAAGYAGTDFLEGFISNYLTPAAKTSALNTQKTVVDAVVSRLSAAGFKAPTMAPSAPPNQVTVRQNHRYGATITLSWFEQGIATNSMIAQRFTDLGFKNVTATGSGGTREVEGTWPAANTTVTVDDRHVSNIHEILPAPQTA
jgi:hypothetical protein